ncbi:FkbM family methyltransferase [Jannaschia sp. AI_61]|nr:FkbM family methyltransferase [Jannaschia sp. AI_61]
MTIVHVGAHEGQEAATYQAFGAGHVVFVEADPDRLPRLKAHVDKVATGDRPKLTELLRLPRTKFTVLGALVGDTDGAQVPFYRFSNEGASSSIFRKAQLEEDRFPTVSETGETLSLPMQRLDTLLKTAGIAPETVDCLTLDVQGAELLCLRGAPETLRSAKVLEVEVANSGWYAGGVLVEELEPWLQERGFSRTTMLRKKWVFQDVIFRRSKG